MTAILRPFLLMVSLALGAMQVAVAAVPNTLTYQGTLTDGAGTPITGEKTITLSLYTADTGGTAFWTETQTLTLVDGRLSVVLGKTTDNLLDPSKFTGETYIGIKVGTDTEMPRQKFSSVAYAFQAGDGVPKGGIIMWSGTVANIPAGWALCNGLARTLLDGSVVTPPNLQDKFIVGAGSGYSPGAAGGVASNDISHAHSISGESPGMNWVGDHQHSFGGNTSEVQGEINTVDDKDDSNKNSVAGNSHYHSYSGSTTWTGGHNHTVDAHSHGGATGAAGRADLDNRPPYYALAFIMKL